MSTEMFVALLLAMLAGNDLADSKITPAKNAEQFIVESKPNVPAYRVVSLSNDIDSLLDTDLKKARKSATNERQLTELRRRAEQGDVEAQFNLGTRALLGYGMAVDTAAGVHWYQAAATQGYAPAQTNLGTLYSTGRGVNKSPDEAVRWFRKAAEQGNATGEYNLGAAYFSGRGAPRDSTQALVWFRRAAEHESAMAQWALGMIEDDKSAAVNWFRRAAGKGYAPAQYELAMLLLKNPDKSGLDEALDLLKKSAAQEFANAEFELAGAYFVGVGVKQDAQTALSWYRKAAAQGHAAAMRNIGVIYVNGTGVEKNDVEAYRWFDRAARRKDAKAIEYRTRLTKSLSPEQLRQLNFTPCAQDPDCGATAQP